MKHTPKHRNILQWRAARAKYEAKIRQVTPTPLTMRRNAA